MNGAAGWRSECPISASLDIVGDRWTLLVLRDLLDGKTRFSEIEQSPEGIPTNILTDRLRRLVETDLATRERSGRRVDYSLTPKGEDMRPVLLAMVSWANSHVPGTWVPPADYLAGSDPAGGVAAE